MKAEGPGGVIQQAARPVREAEVAGVAYGWWVEIIQKTAREMESREQGKKKSSASAGGAGLQHEPHVGERV